MRLPSENAPQDVQQAGSRPGSWELTLLCGHKRPGFHNKHDGPQACSPQRHRGGKGCLPCGAGAGAAQSSLNAHAACLGEPTPSFASCRRAQRSPSLRRAHTAVSFNLAPCLRGKATALQAASCCTDRVLCLQSNNYLLIHAVAAWVKRRRGLRPVVGGAPPSDVFSTAAILGLQLPSTLAARASASARPPQRRNRTGSRGSLLDTAAAQQHTLSVTCSGCGAALWEHYRYVGPMPHIHIPSVPPFSGGLPQVSHRCRTGLCAQQPGSGLHSNAQAESLFAGPELCHFTTLNTPLHADWAGPLTYFPCCAKQCMRQAVRAQ